MPGELAAGVQALVAALAVACPARVVRRGFVPYPQLQEAELLAGALHVLALGEAEFANWRGREADLGVLRVVIVGQVLADARALPPGAGPEALSAAVQDAEFALAEEVKGFLVDPAPLRQCLATGFEQSGQMECPFGWVAFECEVVT